MTALEDRPVTLSEEKVEPAPAPHGSGVLRIAGSSIGLLGVLTLAFVGYLAFLSPLQHDRDQATMFADFKYDLAQGVAPVGPTEPGRAVGLLKIPRLDLQEVVVEGTTSKQLTHGPGHRRDTPLPGQPGVSVLYGRAGTFGAPFKQVDKLRSGDVITVATGQGLATYQVTGTGPSVLAPAPGKSTLVLVTADDGMAPTGQALVTASLTSTVVPGNTGLPMISRAEVGLSGDGDAVVPLVLWAEALLVAMGVTTWAYARWARWPTYVTSTPVLLAIIWNIFENLARLLPNTL